MDECSVCHQHIVPTQTVTEVQLEVLSRYIRADGSIEDMNGFWRKTQEFFCEDCFLAYADVLKDFYVKRQTQKS